MRNNVRVLRRLGLLLAVVTLLCLAPGSARANAPSPKSPWRTIILSDTGEVESIAVYVDRADGSFYLLQTFASEHIKKQEIRFQKPDDAKYIYVAVTMKDGTIRTSDPVESVTRRDLKYDVKSNILKVKADLGLLYVPLFLLEVVVSFAFLLWIVVLLEVAVVLVEYLFYTRKYKDHPKGKLLLFSLIANALSWGLFELVQRLVF